VTLREHPEITRLSRGIQIQGGRRSPIPRGRTWDLNAISIDTLRSIIILINSDQFRNTQVSRDSSRLTSDFFNIIRSRRNPGRGVGVKYYFLPVSAYNALAPLDSFARTFHLFRVHGALFRLRQTKSSAANERKRSGGFNRAFPFTFGRYFINSGRPAARESCAIL